jgi:hypothetical protein
MSVSGCGRRAGSAGKYHTQLFGLAWTRLSHNYADASNTGAWSAAWVRRRACLWNHTRLAAGLEQGGGQFDGDRRLRAAAGSDSARPLWRPARLGKSGVAARLCQRSPRRLLAAVLHGPSVRHRFRAIRHPAPRGTMFIVRRNPSILAQRQWGEILGWWEGRVGRPSLFGQPPAKSQPAGVCPWPGRPAIDILPLRGWAAKRCRLLADSHSTPPSGAPKLIAVGGTHPVPGRRRF